MTTSPTSTSGAGIEGLPPSFRHDWISLTMRRLEPWVAFSIAAYTAFIALVAYLQVPALWLFVLYAALIGKWSDVHPARLQVTMFMRAAALIAGGYILHTHTSHLLPGPGGVFFFWLSITTMYYAFMLKPVWGVALVSLAVASYAASAMGTGLEGGALNAIARGGYLVFFPLVVAMRFGSVMRRPDQALEQRRLDQATGLYNKEGLLEHGADLVETCQRDRRPLSLIVLDCADLQEIRGVYGRQVNRKLRAKIIKKLASVAGDRGLLARTGATEFSLLVPGMGREKVLAALERVMGNPGRIELDWADSEIVLVPDYAAGSIKPGETGLADLYLELSSDLAAVRHDMQMREDHYRRQRERVSAPMDLAEQVTLPGPLGPRAPFSMPMPVAVAARGGAVHDTEPAPLAAAG
jgi:diguanylate cyclase (GGDEF)-like protein